MKDKKAYAGIIVTGAVIGLIAVALVFLGNPKNMGFCIACFLRDIAGATKLHSAPIVQYFRPVRNFLQRAVPLLSPASSWAHSL